MHYDNEIYRRPYRRGDYHLVDTTRAGTYWRSPEGIVVQMASAEPERTSVRSGVWQGPLRRSCRPKDGPGDETRSAVPRGELRPSGGRAAAKRHARGDDVPHRASCRDRRFRVLCAALPTRNGDRRRRDSGRSFGHQSRAPRRARSPGPWRNSALRPPIDVMDSTTPGVADNVRMWTEGVPVEDAARAQIANLARLPILGGPIAIMPDVHPGKGATVGSVIATRARSSPQRSASTSAAAWSRCARR